MEFYGTGGGEDAACAATNPAGVMAVISTPARVSNSTLSVMSIAALALFCGVRNMFSSQTRAFADRYAARIGC